MHVENPLDSLFQEWHQLRVMQSPLASRLARENTVDVSRRWNYLCGELGNVDN